MNRVTLDLVASYLNNYGWCYEETSENRLHTGWVGDVREYPLEIEINESTVLFQVSPLMSLDVDWLHWPELSLFLLELNFDSQLVKISINSSGEITVSAFAMKADLSFESFSNILGIIGYYCDVFYDEIISCLEICGFQNFQRPSLLL